MYIILDYIISQERRELFESITNMKIPDDLIDFVIFMFTEMDHPDGLFL